MVYYLQDNVLNEPIFVGRKQEFEEIQQFLDCAINGKGTTIFISGEAGSGKTRLVAEFLELAKKVHSMHLTREPAEQANCCEF